VSTRKEVIQNGTGEYSRDKAVFRARNSRNGRGMEEADSCGEGLLQDGRSESNRKGVDMKSWVNYYVGYVVKTTPDSGVTKIKISGSRKHKARTANRVHRKG